VDLKPIWHLPVDGGAAGSIELSWSCCLDIHLIDGTYELFRHYYALPSARDRDGHEVAAVRGVLGSVLGMIRGGATHIAVATDHVIESFRNGLWAKPLPSGDHSDIRLQIPHRQRRFRRHLSLAAQRPADRHRQQSADVPPARRWQPAHGRWGQSIALDPTGTLTYTRQGNVNFGQGTIKMCVAMRADGGNGRNLRAIAPCGGIALQLQMATAWPSPSPDRPEFSTRAVVGRRPPR
jgi:hypothetical protein